MNYNPIIGGFNPDPSICKAGDTFYLAVSTFEFFPGVTIYESRDLMHWSYCNSALGTEELLPLKGCRNSSGIYAATIRYNNGRWYVVTTNKHIKENFIVLTDDIHSLNWSDRKPINNMGIDPSLFFDDDNSCYYCSNGVVDGVRGILGAPIDPDSGKLLAPLKLLTVGISGYATEGPHIYKRNGRYFLIFSEGGTEYGHHCCAMSSIHIDGPYTPCIVNSILSHTDRKDHPIQATGHADLIDVGNDQWMAVFLAFRLPGKAHLHNLGRETFISPVSWNNDEPIIGLNGHIELGEASISESIRYQFDSPICSFPFLRIRQPNVGNYLLDIHQHSLTLIGSDALTTPQGSPTVLCLRQAQFKSKFTATLLPNTLQGTAGIVVWYAHDYNLKFGIRTIGQELQAYLIRTVHGYSSESSSCILENYHDQIVLTIESDNEAYRFYANGMYIDSAPIACVCTEAIMYMSFTGTLFGIWSENGKATFIKELLLEHQPCLK